MITTEDIERFRQMQEDQPKKTVVIETMQLFEIEIPADIDAQTFVNSQVCRDECSELIKHGIVDLTIDRIEDYSTS